MFSNKRKQEVNNVQSKDNTVDLKKNHWFKDKFKREKILKIVCVMFITIFIAVGVLLSYIYLSNKEAISRFISNGYDKVSNINENTFNSRYSTQLLDKDGNLIKEFKVINYKYQTYDQIDKRVLDAFVSIEDERFYKHKGIDYIGLMRAGSKIILSRGETIQGGSTITQQLVKNTFLTLDQTVWRKLEEMVIAQELEKKYSKEDILEFYVNNINFGYGCYSIETASDFYFQKESKDLTLAEISLLVAIPNNPTFFDPINNYENANDRKEIILNKMFELGKISEEELNNALSEEIKLNVKDVSFDNNTVGYEQDYAMQKATEEFMKLNGFQFRYKFNDNEERDIYFSEYEKLYEECRQELITGGYIINTSIDNEKQKQLQDIVDEEFIGYTELQENGLYMRQASATIIDNETGEVVAIVGGRSQDGNSFNRASLGARQPGSTLKPLISYTPSYEKGYFPDFVMEDKEIENGPANWYLSYKGNVTLRYATEISLNTIPYRLTDEIGVENVLNKLQNMKFKYLTPEDNSPIIAIGGMTRGTTTVELAGAYSTLERNGEYIEPTNIKKITKIGTNEIVYENNHFKERIYEAGASYLMTDTLKGVLFKAHGTGYSAKIPNWENQAGKTGSTDNDKDLWTVTYTPYYTTAVWVGDDFPTAIYSGLTAPKNINRKIMTFLHQGLEDKPFDKPENIYEENGFLKAKASKENEIINKRKSLEEDRKSKEIATQNERLQESEYRIKYGLSEEEEYAREIKAENDIKILENYAYNSLNQESELKELINSARLSLNDVKRKSAYDTYMSRLDSIILKLEAENDKLYEELRAKEEERIKEEEAQRKKEEEKKKQEEKIEQENEQDVEIEVEDSTEE